MECYEAYKDSGVEWIGKIPINWKIVKVKNRYHFTTGFTPETKRQDYYDDVDGYPWANISDMSAEKISSTQHGISKLYIDSFKPIPVPKGSLLYSFKLSVGETAIAECPLYTNEAIASFEPQKNPCLDFFRYSSSLIIKAANENIYGAKILNSNLIRNAPVVFPPIPEQQAIAGYLDAKTGEIDGLIADCEREVELLQEYRKSVISEAVTKGLNPAAPMKDAGIEWIGEIPEDWNVARLDGIAERKSGHTPDKKVPEYWDGSIVWISLADSQSLRSERYLNASNTMTTEAGIQNSSAELLPAGSVLLSRDASVGLTAIAGVPLAVSQHFMAYICGNGLYNEYLRYVFMAMHQEFERLSMGSTIPTIGLPLIKQLMIPYPPKAVQVEIVSCLDTKTAEIDALIKDKQTMVDKLREYRKSLISEAVTGKFKVPGI